MITPRHLLGILALCSAALLHAGWFDPEFDIKISRVAGGDTSWNATQFYTTSAISSDGSVLVSREDGLYFKGAKINTKGGKIRHQGATICQKEDLVFYSASGKEGGIFSADSRNGEVNRIFTIPAYGPEVARYNVSPLSVTADCNKLVFSTVAWPGNFGLRTEGFHEDYQERQKAVLFSNIYLAERTPDGWNVRELHREKRWLSHPDIEPQQGQFITYTWDGRTDKVTVQVLDIASGASKAIHHNDIPGRIIHPFWFGDGKHLGAIHWQPFGAKKIVRYNIQTGEFLAAEIPGDWNPHEAVGKMLKNGNALIATDGKYSGQQFKQPTGPLLLLEIDFTTGKTIRMDSVMRYGPRFSKTNHILPSDEGWFPHPNISQDGRFISFTSSNGNGDKGSDVYLISHLPE